MPMMLRSAGFVIFRRFSDKEIPDLPEYLLLQASYGSNHWSPPKGEVEYFEPDYQAAVRETREETGLTSEVLKMAFEISETIEYVNRKGRPKKATYWLAELLVDTPIVLSEEHQAYQWFPAQEARTKCMYQDLSRVIDDFHEFITNGNFDDLYGSKQQVDPSKTIDYTRYNFNTCPCGEPNPSPAGA